MPDELHPNPADPLGEVLHSLGMTGNFYCRSELTEPWGLTLPALKSCLWFHAVTSGRCELSGEGFGPLVLSPGDFALVSENQGHVLRTAAGVAAPQLLDLPHEMAGDRYALLHHGGGSGGAALQSPDRQGGVVDGASDFPSLTVGAMRAAGTAKGQNAKTTLISGVVRFDHYAAHDLTSVLPPVIHLDAFTSPHSGWMQTTLQLLAVESRQISPGGETIVTRLADILVIQALRSWLQNDPAARTGWLGALQDTQLGRALVLVHREPDRDWSVASMAAESTMSRSAFAARFTVLVGEPPMHYLRRVRMKLASEMLTAEPNLTAGIAGTRIGYHSEAAFNRAFKRLIGTPPGAGRQKIQK